MNVLFYQFFINSPPGGPPPAPTGLHTTAVLPTEIDLAWSVNTAAETGQILERSPDNSTWAQIATPAQMDSAYADTGLTPSTQYYYRIKATNSGVDSPYSSTINATTPGPGSGNPVKPSMMWIGPGVGL